jgi:hypothetical protein
VEYSTERRGVVVKATSAGGIARMSGVRAGMQIAAVGDTQVVGAYGTAAEEEEGVVKGVVKDPTRPPIFVKVCTV